ncbi:MAG: fused MFS/spermidine synthase [Verrucomicrobiae bacterium]|nr:fused MFS/spermidine synthase [Verrucomicrobiae bacterium]
MLPAYALTIFLSAALLFAVQPMMAKMVLPLLGGSPAVWNTSMVFFQTALLAGYLYAHLLTRRVSPSRQVLVHAVVVVLPLLGAALAGDLPVLDPRAFAVPEGRFPALWLLGVLALAVGGPFFVLSTTGPLMQRWFAATTHKGAQDPYFLYAASNVGSMLALVGYPLVMERAMHVGEQRLCFSMGYAAFVALAIACGVLMLRARPTGAVTRQQRRRLRDEAGAPAAAVAPAIPGAVAWRARLLWVALAAAPSSLMLGVTQHISSDIAAVPLLWVIPLALYLLTFIIAFGGRALPLRPLALLFFALASGLAAMTVSRLDLAAWSMVGAHLLAFFVGALVCHGRLAAARPGAGDLTEYYLLVALGGVIGGSFNGILAPVIFDGIAEYPVAIVAVCLLVAPSCAGLVPGAAGARRMALGAMAPLAVAAVTALAYFQPASLGRQLLVSRTFFGVHRVIEGPRGQWRLLMHGTTRHGIQATSPRDAMKPTMYYHPTGPIGQILRRRGNHPDFDRIAIVGLGTGGLAAYGQAHQTITYYEIDPEVVRIARDSGCFTFLRDTRAKIEIVVGDGRLAIAKAPPKTYDLIILDAFSSDAVPIHLMTREAIQVYFDKLADGGVIAANVSNRYLELRPPLGAAAMDLGCVSMHWDDSDVSEFLARQGKLPTTWVALARRREDFAGLMAGTGWTLFDVAPEAPRWTDDYSNVLSALMWD